MITIAKALEGIIIKTPYLEEAVSKGLINISALARFLKPELKKQLFKKDVSQGALVMALKRLQPKIKKRAISSKFALHLDNITVRSSIVEIILLNSPQVEKIRKELARFSFSDSEAFFSLIQGVRESTFIVSKNLEKIVTRDLKKNILLKIDGLSSISIALPPENRHMPGVYYGLLKTLAWNNINLVEVISNYNQLNLIFRDSDVGRAFPLVKSIAA